jgi:hypothetical protein
MKKYIYLIQTIFLLSFVSYTAFGQGLINNGAYIVLSSGPYIEINGSTGNYLNQDASGPSYGRITVNTSGTIDVNGNWTNNSADPTDNVFTSSVGTVELVGTAQVIGGTASTYFNNLNLLGSGTKTLNVNTLVGGGYSSPTGILAVGSDVMDLNQHTLTMNNPATGGITYSSGYIISETNTAVNPSIIKWNIGTSTGSYVYPFGVSGTQIPFTFQKTTAGSSNVSVSTRATASNDNTPYAGISDNGTVPAVSNMLSVWGGSAVTSVIDRWWDIYASAATTANVTFTYRGSENTMTVNPTGPIRAQHWNGTGWDWPLGAGTGVIAGTGTATVNGASTFSPWILVASSAPLPIELYSFTSTCQGNSVSLNWITASETNNSYFTVQRSADGNNFEDVTNITGKGNSNTMVNYSYIDTHPYSGLSYYRLKQTDFNNDFTYSPIIISDCGISGFDIVNVIPDENNHITTFNYSVEANGSYHLSVYDLLGNLIINNDLHPEVGFNKVVLDFSSFAHSMYLIVLSNNTKSITRKFIY